MLGSFIECQAFLSASTLSPAGHLSGLNGELWPDVNIHPGLPCDINCTFKQHGNGLQPLARLGATVTGIDLSEESVGAAAAHAQADPQLSALLKYRTCSADDVLREGQPALAHQKLACSRRSHVLA